jgi:hypothetical protein
MFLRKSIIKCVNSVFVLFPKVNFYFIIKSFFGWIICIIS